MSWSFKLKSLSNLSLRALIITYLDLVRRDEVVSRNNMLPNRQKKDISKK
jgi:hypothetical protein